MHTPLDVIHSRLAPSVNVLLPEYAENPANWIMLAIQDEMDHKCGKAIDAAERAIFATLPPAYRTLFGTMDDAWFKLVLNAQKLTAHGTGVSPLSKKTLEALAEFAEDDVASTIQLISDHLSEVFGARMKQMLSVHKEAWKRMLTETQQATTREFADANMEAIPLMAA